jgi:hypothetical protein
MDGLALREEDFVRAFLDGGTLDITVCLFHLLKQYLSQYDPSKTAMSSSIPYGVDGENKFCKSRVSYFLALPNQEQCKLVRGFADAASAHPERNRPFPSCLLSLSLKEIGRTVLRSHHLLYPTTSNTSGNHLRSR